MKLRRRNDKQNQRNRLHAQYEAQQTLQELHNLLARPDRDGLTVGEMVNTAASMGLLNQPKQLVFASRSYK